MLPIRDGNRGLARRREHSFQVYMLPIRDGNLSALYLHYHYIRSLYASYKGWKPEIPFDKVLIVVVYMLPIRDGNGVAEYLLFEKF